MPKPPKRWTPPETGDKGVPLTESARGALNRMAKRIADGFEGEITTSVKQGGVPWLRWSHTESGEVLKEDAS